jgi:hypothetical protein
MLCSPFGRANHQRERNGALFSEYSLKCARKLLDTADIVRDAIFHQLSGSGRSWISGCRIMVKGLDL